MNKTTLKEVLDYNIMQVIKIQNEEEKTKNYNCNYNFYAIEIVLSHLRDYLLENGIRKFNFYYKNFDAYEYLMSHKYITFCFTYMQEKTFKSIMQKLKDIIESC